MSNNIIKFFIVSCVFCGMTSASFAEELFSQQVNFQSTSKHAEDKKLPILVFFSASDCDDCDTVQEEFLQPMLKSGDYLDKIIVRVVITDNGDEIRDFNGELVSVEAFSDRYDLELTPTIILLDSQGKELSARLVGMGAVSFYGGYLDEAIDASLQLLRK